MLELDEPELGVDVVAAGVGDDVEVGVDACVGVDASVGVCSALLVGADDVVGVCVALSVGLDVRVGASVALSVGVEVRVGATVALDVSSGELLTSGRPDRVGLGNPDWLNDGLGRLIDPEGSGNGVDDPPQAPTSIALRAAMTAIAAARCAFICVPSRAPPPGHRRCLLRSLPHRQGV